MANANRPAITVPTVEGTESIRCSFPTLAKPTAVQGGDRKTFSITLMFDKQNPRHIDVLKQIKSDLEACLVEQWPDEATRPRIPLVADQPTLGPRCPIKDGDVAVNQKNIPLREKNAEYAGHYLITASCGEDSPPHVCGPNMEAINPGNIKGGYWVKCNLNCYAYTGGSGGVSIGLNGVQLIREDETFGGGRPAPDSMFGAVGPDPSAYQGGGDLDNGAATQQPGNTDAWLNGGENGNGSDPAPASGSLI